MSEVKATESGVSAQQSVDFDSIPGKTWIDKLQYSFSAAGGTLNGITIDQWMKSPLRFIISDSQLSENQMREYFQQIDANCDSIINWTELIDYLMCHRKVEGGVHFTRKLRLDYHSPDLSQAKKIHRSTVCLRSRYLSHMDQIVTLSDTLLTFWSLEDCSILHTFSDKEAFVDFCYLPSIAKLAIAKQNRQIIFYDLRTHSKLKFFISASLDTSIIPQLDYQESQEMASAYRHRRVPLFNSPTALESNPEYPYIFVGDEEGRIEVFSIFTARSAKYDWDSQRVSLFQLHESSVSQILYIPDSDQFASSSLDGSLCLWKYSFKTHSMLKEAVFRNTSPIVTFVYSPRTSDFAYLTSSHSFGVWKADTQRSATVETQSQIINAISIVTLSEESSFLVTVTKTNFFSVYVLPSLQPCGSWFMGLCHETCPPTSALCIANRLYLVGAFLSSWYCINADNDGMKPHSEPILGCLPNDLFDRLITGDVTGSFISWDVNTGNKEFAFSLQATNVKANCFALDALGRRLAIGFSDGSLKVVASNSGSILSQIDKKFNEGGSHFLLFDKLQNSRKLFSCARKSIVVFDDLPRNRIQFARSFIGHSENVIRCYVIKESYVLSIGIEKEMFLWSMRQQNPVIKYKIPNDPSVAADIPNEQKVFIVGDISGFIHFVSVEGPEIFTTIDVFKMNTKCAITNLLVTGEGGNIIAANMLGYVDCMLRNSDKVTEDSRFRAHNGRVLQMSISEKHRVLITTSEDGEVKIWSFEPFGCVGSLGKPKKWDLKKSDKSEIIPEDPTHFIKVVKPIEEESEDDEEEFEQKGASLSIEIPKVSFESAKDLLLQTEEICLSGRELYKHMPEEIQNYPNSARIVKPNVQKISFFDLVNERELETTSERVKVIIKSLKSQE